MASTLFSNLSNKVKHWFSFNEPEKKPGEERSGSNGNIYISNETRDPFHFADNVYEVGLESKSPNLSQTSFVDNDMPA